MKRKATPRIFRCSWNIHLTLLMFVAISACSTLFKVTPSEPVWEWNFVETVNTPDARHEAALIAVDHHLYLMGGRGIKPVNVYDPESNRWENRSETPIELHHFQAVEIDGAVYIIGALSGQWPNEKPVDRVIVYDPERDEFVYTHSIPKDRRRGSAGAVAHNGKIYIVGGITNGHMDGTVPWLDVYDPKTGAWRTLPDAPHARDHFQLVKANNKLHAFAGRRTRHRTGEGFDLTAKYGDIFDLDTERWETVKSSAAIPTKRAGNMAVSWGDEIIFGGGESGTQIVAHNETEAFNSKSHQWRDWPSLKRGRHGSGFAILDGYLYTASGSGNRGGAPELVSLERLKLPAPLKTTLEAQPPSEPIHQQWHAVTLSFEGPQTDETAIPNPFTDYRLLVDFTHKEHSYTVRGHYAADGNAAETSASSGSIWHAKFTPDLAGQWTYQARLEAGEMVALASKDKKFGQVELSNPTGSFIVEPSDKEGRDFRAHGRLKLENGYFRFAGSNKYWLKGGANSPENLLGYGDFDGTFRIAEQSREGEAASGEGLHSFEPHARDWKLGDPSWQDGKGKNLIGAINYLASTGMNAVYFLTFNIDGDGKDVWPFLSPSDFSRFDVSKLDQWDIVFSHMQSQGILLHIVTQETENELLLDGGDTGPQRQLYFDELIARFGHHPGLIWNLGEENGPVHWRPEGQNTEQRVAMIEHISAADPYDNPIFLHTHAEIEDKETIISPLLGLAALDGLSFQVADRNVVNAEIRKWRDLSEKAGSPWSITMDEIGMWHTGAKPDSVDPLHDSLRRHALWGTLLGGGAGVEWYFGAKFPANDLTSEDWRMRSNLWKQTNIALKFFEEHVPYWDMQPCQKASYYCLSNPGQVYVGYIIHDQSKAPLLEIAPGEYTIDWFDPIKGGELKTGKEVKLSSKALINLDWPPKSTHDWVVLVRRKS